MSRLRLSVGGHAESTTRNVKLQIQPTDNAATEFIARRRREQRRHYARRPKKIADVLAQLITARGYGRIQADADFMAAWQEAAGEALAKFTRPGQIRRGQLEVTVANSTIVQEITFQKQRILAALQAAMPDAHIRDLRFRLGPVQ
jgi:predicted nucleic acid-binding Zn ribbon protein